ncbi:MAG: response regulator [Pseudomonadota bacterium]
MPAALPSANLEKTLSILSIEDDDVDAMAIAKAFDVEGAELTAVTTLAAGKRELDSSCFDIVLLDLNLPDSWPPETMSEVTQRMNGAALIVLSSHIDIFRSVKTNASAEEPIVFFLPKEKLMRPEFVSFVLFTGQLNQK